MIFRIDICSSGGYIMEKRKDDTVRKTAEKGIREIAEATGFNISTVSRALNNRSGVSAESAAKILRTALEFGYRSGKTPVYAVLLPETSQGLGWYSLNMLDALRRVAMERGFLLEIVFSDHAEILRERCLAGIISFDYSSQIVRKLSVALPVVCINDFSWHIADVYSVCSNIAHGVRNAVSLLVSYGHRKIGMLINGDSATESNRERAAAFEECRIRYALAPESALCFRAEESGQNSPYLYGSMRTLTERGVTAVINCGESESVEALAALRLCGLRVPQDLSLICWEVPRFSKFLEPPLTTVQQNFPRLAEEAFNMLERLIRKESVTADVLVDCLLHERGSVSVPPAGR